MSTDATWITTYLAESYGSPVEGPFDTEAEAAAIAKYLPGGSVRPVKRLA